MRGKEKERKKERERKRQKRKREREYLKSSTVCHYKTREVHEFMQTTSFLNQLRTRTQQQMICTRRQEMDVGRTDVILPLLLLSSYLLSPNVTILTSVTETDSRTELMLEMFRIDHFRCRIGGLCGNETMEREILNDRRLRSCCCCVG
jgi:hypothetical protein